MHDLIIIGSGIAGMTASIYASRYGIKHLIFGEIPGGQGNLAHMVENYPGVLSIKGPQLMGKIIEQVKSYNVDIRQEKVGGLKKVSAGYFKVETGKGEYGAKSLILAMGASYRHLNILGEDNFLGRGVSYCAICDAPFFKDKIVAVAGGGDSAVSGAIHVSNFAKKVYLIHRRNEFRAEKAWVEKLRKKKNIEVILSSVIKEVYGKEKVEGIIIKSLKSRRAVEDPRQKSPGHENIKTRKQFKIDGLFIEIGQAPSSVLAKQLRVKLDKGDYVLVDSDMATNVSGVFAAGDLAAQKGGILFRQFVTAAADGARAASSVYHYLVQKPAAPSWGKQ